MSVKYPNKNPFFVEFASELKAMFGDIVFLYQHFFHWTFSRILIFVWSIVLGVLFALPFFLITCVVGWLDPIAWLSFFGSESTMMQQRVLLEPLASHPYWFVLILFLIVKTILVFLLASSYFIVLYARLSLKYIERKKLEYSKNIYFSRKHITTLMSLLSWNFLYLLAPVMIWCGAVFFMYLPYKGETISLPVLSYALLAATILLFFACIYTTYRILFGYILLAEEKDPKHIHRARKYLYTSIKCTQGKSIVKFFFVITLFLLMMSPFRATELYLDDTITSMTDALAFKSKLIGNIDAEDMA